MLPKHPLLLAAALVILWQGPAYANSIRSDSDTPEDDDVSDFTPFRFGESEEDMPRPNFRLPPTEDVGDGSDDDSEEYANVDDAGTFRDLLGISLGLKHNSDTPSKSKPNSSPPEKGGSESNGALGSLIPARRPPIVSSDTPTSPEIIDNKQEKKENGNLPTAEFTPEGRAGSVDNQAPTENENKPPPTPITEPSPSVEPPPPQPSSIPAPSELPKKETNQPVVIASAAADGGPLPSATPEPTPIEGSPTSTTSESGSKNTLIAVIGVIVSVGMCACVGGLLFCLRRQRKKQSEMLKNGSFLRASIQARNSKPGGALDTKSPPKPSAFVVSLPSPTEAVYMERGGEHDLFAYDSTPQDASRPHASFSTEVLTPNTARKRQAQNLSPRQMGEQHQPLRRSSSGLTLSKKGLSAQGSGGSGMIRSASIEFGQMSPSPGTERKDRWQNIDLAPGQMSTPEDSPRQGTGLEEIDI